MDLKMMKLSVFKIIVRHLHILNYIRGKEKHRRLIFLQEGKKNLSIDRHAHHSDSFEKTSVPKPGDNQSHKEICKEIGTQDDSAQKDKMRFLKRTWDNPTPLLTP